MSYTTPMIYFISGTYQAPYKALKEKVCENDVMNEMLPRLLEECHNGPFSVLRLRKNKGTRPIEYLIR